MASRGKNPFFWIMSGLMILGVAAIIYFFVKFDNIIMMYLYNKSSIRNTIIIISIGIITFIIAAWIFYRLIKANIKAKEFDYDSMEKSETVRIIRETSYSKHLSTETFNLSESINKNPETENVLKFEKIQLKKILGNVEDFLIDNRQKDIGVVEFSKLLSLKDEIDYVVYGFSHLSTFDHLFEKLKIYQKTLSVMISGAKFEQLNE